jgi:hypothetical protein
MTREKLDSDEFSGAIGNTNSISLTVDTARADDVIVLIDNGNTDGAPDTYTMTQRVYTSEFDDFQFYDEVTGETSRSWVGNAWEEKMEFEFTNTSGSSAQYRIVIRSFRDV